MKLLIIGATGGTGKELVLQALKHGHDVTALVRNPKKVTVSHERLTIIGGDVLDYNSVERAVQGNDVVLSALGHKRWFLPSTILSEGTQNILAAMEKHGVKRFVCETSLGIGDTRGKLGLYYTLFVVPFIAYFYFRDKEKQERYIKESKLDWVIVRPGQLTNGRKRGTYKHGFDIGNYITTVTISRADVADFMLKQVTDNTYLRRTPGVSY
jgi:putative NADH-flavin reductase